MKFEISYLLAQERFSTSGTALGKRIFSHRRRAAVRGRLTEERWRKFRWFALQVSDGSWEDNQPKTRQPLMGTTTRPTEKRTGELGFSEDSCPQTVDSESANQHSTPRTRPEGRRQPAPARRRPCFGRKKTTVRRTTRHPAGGGESHLYPWARENIPLKSPFPISAYFLEFSRIFFFPREQGPPHFLAKVN